MSYFPENKSDIDKSGVKHPSAAGDAAASPRLSLRQKLGAFWLNLLFFAAAHVPWLARLTVSFWVWAGWLFSPAMRRNTLANARHVLGGDASGRELRRLARGIIRSSFLFVYDVGRHRRMTPQQMRAEITSVQGQPHYEEARALKRGLIVATAHFGAFEGAVASLREREEHVHVIFQRDRFSRFDAVRSELHERLGVIEAPIDDGIHSWMCIREALLRDEVVLIQADRVMPGQRGMRLPFLGGIVEIPIGPAKLSLLTGAPIVPIFAIRHSDGTLSIEIKPAITVDAQASGNPLEPAVMQTAATIERMIRRHPHQWLMLHQPWCEPQESPPQPVATKPDQVHEPLPTTM